MLANKEVSEESIKVPNLIPSDELPQKVREQIEDKLEEFPFARCYKFEKEKKVANLIYAYALCFFESLAAPSFPLKHLEELKSKQEKEIKKISSWWYSHNKDIKKPLITLITRMIKHRKNEESSEEMLKENIEFCVSYLKAILDGYVNNELEEKGKKYKKLVSGVHEEDFDDGLLTLFNKTIAEAFKLKIIWMIKENSEISETIYSDKDSNGTFIVFSTKRRSFYILYSKNYEHKDKLSDCKVVLKSVLLALKKVLDRGFNEKSLGYIMDKLAEVNNIDINDKLSELLKECQEKSERLLEEQKNATKEKNHKPYSILIPNEQSGDYSFVQKINRPKENPKTNRNAALHTAKEYTQVRKCILCKRTGKKLKIITNTCRSKCQIQVCTDCHKDLRNLTRSK